MFDAVWMYVYACWVGLCGVWVCMCTYTCLRVFSAVCMYVFVWWVWVVCVSAGVHVCLHVFMCVWCCMDVCLLGRFMCVGWGGEFPSQPSKVNMTNESINCPCLHFRTKTRRLLWAPQNSTT